MPTKPKQPPILAAIGDRVKDRPPKAKHAHLDDDDKLVILWGLSRGWAARKIARAVPCSEGSVKNYKNRLFEDPGVLFELPLLLQTAPKVHQCQLCREQRPSRSKAMRHVLSHVLPYEVARDIRLDDVEKPL
ncbi:MAG: hypothetical protein O2913_14410 [Chloroflexi bacterium]|nr:hypothetical protein [Chloroflexota bacterium]